MNGPDPTPDGLQTHADLLASAGDWEGLRAALTEADPALVAGSRGLAYRFGEALYHTGRMRDLAEFAKRYEAEARAASDLEGTMRALNLDGIAAFELGEIDRAEKRWEELLGLADVASDPDMLARASNNLGAVANLRGDGRTALAFYRLAVPSYQRLHQSRGLAQTYHNLGVSHRDLEEYDDAIAAFTRAIAIAEKISYAPVVVMTLVSRGELEVRRGDPALAVGLAERALKLAREQADPINEGGALRVRGLGRIGSGDGASGLQDLRDALALARESENALLAAEALRDLGRALLSRGAPDASDHLRAAADAFAALGARAEAERAAADLPEDGSPDGSPTAA